MGPAFLGYLTLSVAILFLTCDFELRDVLIDILVDFLNIHMTIPRAGLALLRVSASLEWSSVRLEFLFHLKLRQIHIEIFTLIRLRSSLISCLFRLLADFALPR